MSTRDGSSNEHQEFAPPEHWKILDAFDVEKWDCPPRIELVEGMIALGNLVLLAASTQTRKTLLALDMAALFTRGGKLFGKFSVTGRCRVLYLVLEDPDRRIRERLLDIRDGLEDEQLVPQKGEFLVHLAPGLNLMEPDHFDYLEKLIVEGGFHIVFVDTYQKATPGLSSFRDEEQSLILHRLSELTRKHHVTLMVLDHLRKEQNQGGRRRRITIDDIKGTGGKAQNADVVILLEKHGDHQMTFRSFSKDWDRPIQILVDVSPQGSGEPKFQYAGELDTARKGKTDHNRTQVWNGLRPDEWSTMSEFKKKTHLSRATIRRYLKEGIEKGAVEADGKGRYTKYRRINRPVRLWPYALESNEDG